METVPIRLQTLIANIHNEPDGTQSPPSDLLSRIGASSPFSRSSRSRTESPAPTNPIRCVKAFGKDIYVGCTDGSLIRFTLRSDGPSTGDAYSITSKQLLSSKRPIDSIALVPSVSKALVLSGGTIYYFSLPTLDPIPSTVIQPTRGVISFALDESDPKKDHLAPPKPPPPPSNNPPWLGSSTPKVTLEPVSVCVVRERQIAVYSLAQRLQRALEIPLPSPQSVVVRSGQYLCVADAEYYSMIDLQATTFTPVAPRDSRPLVAVVGPGEFLIGNPAGDAMAGIFVSGMAEPTRPPMEWPIHPLSISVDNNLISALLPDRTIQIHSIPTDMADLPELIYTIQISSHLPSLLRPVSLSFNAGTFLVPSYLRSRLVRRTRFNLLPPPAVSSPEPGEDDTPRTPPSRASRRFQNMSTDSGRSTPIIPASQSHAQAAAVETPTFVESRTLTVGLEGVLGYLPPTMLSHAEGLLDGGKIDECATYVEGVLQNAHASGGLDWSGDFGIDLRYIYARLAFKCIHETRFDDAGDFLFEARLDPRLLIRLFPDLRGGLIGRSDAVNIFAGLEDILTKAESMNDIIMANLVRNYSPIKPSVESAPSTVELFNVLMSSARVMLMRYLGKVREAQRSGPVAPGSEADIVRKAVETVYTKLLIQTSSHAEVQEVLGSSLDNVILEEIVPVLRIHGYFSLLIEVYRRRGDEKNLLNIWSKVAEGKFTDPSVENPIGEIIQLLSTTSDMSLFREYGLWLARHEPVAAFSLFASSSPVRDPKRAPASLEDLEILRVFQESSPLVAEQFLEHLVLNRNTPERALHDELASKYLDSLVEELQEDGNDQEYATFASKYAGTPARGPFLVYFASYAPSSKAKTARIKAALFLQGSTMYNVTAARKRLEPFRHILLFERAILDGKTGNDRSALTLLAQLGDFSSAEAYCTLGGEVIPGKVALQVGELAQVQPWARLVAAPRPDSGYSGSVAAALVKRGKTTDESRVKHLLKILMEVYTKGGNDTPLPEMADLLNSQGVNLDVLDVLSSVPENWSLSTISVFLARSFQRTQHVTHEGMIIKGISWGQNLRATDLAFATIRAQGGMLEEPTTPDQPPNPELSSEGVGTSFNEKEKIILDLSESGPEPVVGSVSSVDLRARKEGVVESGSSNEYDEDDVLA